VCRQILKRQKHHEAKGGEASAQLMTPTLNHQNEWGIMGWRGVQGVVGSLPQGEDQEEIKGAELTNLHLILRNLIVLR
jgi:hypothetical protein